MIEMLLEYTSYTSILAFFKFIRGTHCFKETTLSALQLLYWLRDLVQAKHLCNSDLNALVCQVRFTAGIGVSFLAQSVGQL